MQISYFETFDYSNVNQNYVGYEYLVYCSRYYVSKQILNNVLLLLFLENNTSWKFFDVKTKETVILCK